MFIAKHIPGHKWPGIDCPDRTEEEQLAQAPRAGKLAFTLALALIITLFAGALCAGPEVEIQSPPGTAILSGATDSNWPTLYTGQQTYYHTYRLINLGDAPLIVDANPHISPTNCTTIAVHYGAPWKTTLNPGEWQDIDIGAQTNNPGAWSATWTLGNNDITGSEAPYSITISGSAAVDPFGISPALRMVTQPIGGLVGPILMRQPQVEALNAAGTRDTTFNGPITVSLIGGAGPATLGGTVTLNAVNGIAAFSDLTVALNGTAYSAYNFVFAATGYSDAHSWPFQARDYSLATPLGGGASAATGAASCSSGETTGLQCLLGVLTGLALLLRKRRKQRT
jgi:hypothetical protein